MRVVGFELCDYSRKEIKGEKEKVWNNRPSLNLRKFETQVDTAEAVKSTSLWSRPEVECWSHT